MSATRSAYISRLRKAFLLRVHPDRFRTNPDETIRKRQAELVQAVNARLELPDFIAYATKFDYSNRKQNESLNSNKPSPSSTYNFSLIKNDGTVLHRLLLNLNDTVDDIVQGMVDAVRSSGASSFPSPPIISSNSNNNSSSSNTTSSSSHWTEILQKQKQTYYGNNTKFNLISNQGKDLKLFLQNKLDTTKIQKLKSQRIDASAAALVARHTYKFQSIDGTRIGWSSSSSIKLFTSLTKLHDEFSEKFQVKSFYPLRLIFSYDEIEHPLCVYGGTLSLHPAATPLQWLEIFMSITQDALDLIQYHQKIALKNIQLIQNCLKVKIQKGFSCSGREYFLCLQYLADQLVPLSSTDSTTNTEYPLLPINHYFLTHPNTLKLVIESKYTYRSAIIEKKTGNIHINSSTTIPTLLSSFHKLSTKAYDIALQEKNKQKEWKDLKDILRYKLGLQSIDKLYLSNVSNDQIYNCLLRLLSECSTSNEEEVHYDDGDCNGILNYKLRKKIMGQSINITSSGQFCHISDDGSIIIPWDWSGSNK